jgi:serine/threonine protein kinase/formylglycine-generating enzyme required for sulfatase activity
MRSGHTPNVTSRAMPGERQDNPPQPEPSLPETIIRSLESICFRRQNRSANPTDVETLILANPEHAVAIQEWCSHLEMLRDRRNVGGLTNVGPYRIVELLGRGGFGEVFLAEQESPVRRRVALKVLKLGMDSQAILRLFEREQTALGRMNHDAVARIYDAGTTDRGQPYFAMELVEGLPITDYCDEQRMHVRQRIELCVRVCHAVQHAHQKGVIHRDLKPHNVLVAKVGELHQPKLIDFGIARALEGWGDEGTFTEAGVVLGTPAYMAPEQARGDSRSVDTRTDVYSLGAILFELLTGSPPFEGISAGDSWEARRHMANAPTPRPSVKVAGHPAALVRAQLRETTVSTWMRQLRGDLDWIVLKAMAKDPNHRYSSAAGLAADLESYLQHEPVSARPPSARYRFDRFVRRYRVQVVAATFVLSTVLVGSILVAGYAIQARASAVQAQKNEQLATRRADENAQLAAAETLAKRAALQEQTRAEKALREFDMLAAVVLLHRAQEAEDRLYPALPRQVAAMKRWLDGDASKLIKMKPDIEQALADLEARAIPLQPGELEEDLRTHPRAREWKRLSMEVDSLRQAQAVRDGKQLPIIPQLTPDQQSLDVLTLNGRGWVRISPWPEERSIRGEAALGLAYELAAAEKAKGVQSLWQLPEGLSWAYFANGMDREALATMAQVSAAAPEDRRDYARSLQQALDHAIASSGKALADSERDLKVLSEEVNRRRTFEFQSESDAFLHQSLQSLPRDIRDFEVNVVGGVKARIDWALKVQAHAAGHPRSRHTWDEVRAAIAAADDLVASHLYAGQEIELSDDDVAGLVPIGMNPKTMLWEFYDLRTARGGLTDPDAVPIPSHNPDGTIPVTADMGLVFVLLPGATCLLGSQNTDKRQPNFDPDADFDEAPYTVTLAPFFLSRFEMTQAQWARSWMGDESRRWPAIHKIGRPTSMKPGYSGVTPVENVTWHDCMEFTRRAGMQLPTEAQWEYACRAGAETPWYTGNEPESILGHANVLDRLGAKTSTSNALKGESFEDGFMDIAPAGSYLLGNRFGLHDMIGNVDEWCADLLSGYELERRSGDGLRVEAENAVKRVVRGGSCGRGARMGRSANRYGYDPKMANGYLGIRPARALAP